MRTLITSFIIAASILSGCEPATAPGELINQKASLPSTFKLSDLHQKVINTFINNKEHTTSILYGNPKAYEAAHTDKATSGGAYTLVTWRQQDDKHWFGARIPGDLLSAETLTLTGAGTVPSYRYQRYSGKELAKLADTTGTSARVAFILSQKASITP